jgi:glyceraldehyde 3-phosphate dehydrogenase
MKYKIAINGFGRIGRLTFRSFLERNLKDVKIVAINDLGSIDSNLHLLKYDSIHGELNEKFEVTNNKLLISNEEVIFSNEPDPLKLNWKKLGVNLVIESTGRFTKRADAQKHIDSGAKKVLISAPASDPDITVVYGINQEKVNENHKIISNGSCTTNCLAPLAYLINKKIGIDSGYMTTVHSVTGDQNTIDTLHKDLRRARNSLTSMIPTSTGAARAVAEVLPELKGKLDGSAIRVPTPNVSLIDFKFLSKKDTTIGEINKTFIEAEKYSFNKIIQTTSSPLVSSDFNHNSNSSIVDLTETKVVNNKFCRILSWYDNEWGFSNRLVDLSLKLSK